ncbi:MAG: PIN domain-containing protein, partial [Rubrivivax sp.]
RSGTLTVSTQVLQESYVSLIRKNRLEPAHALRLVDAVAANHVVPADAASVLRGLKLSQRYGLSAWDGLIVQAALDSGCTTLYTEDLQAGQRFGQLEVVNPFADTAHEARSAHVAKRGAKRVAQPTAKSPRRRKRSQ